GTPGERRPRDRSAACQAIVERARRDDQLDVGSPIVARRGEPFREEAALERVAVEIPVLPDAEVHVLFAEVRRGSLIEVLYHRVRGDDVGALQEADVVGLESG